MFGEGNHHLHIQCTTPIQQAALMRKRHLNNSSTTHNTLYHLWHGPDGTSIPTTTPRHTSGGIRCIRRDYIKERNPSRKQAGRQNLNQRKESINLYLDLSKNIYERCLPRQARGRILYMFSISLYHITSLDSINFILGSYRALQFTQQAHSLIN